MMNISLKEARSYMVSRQLLSNRFPAGKEGVLSVIERLGYIQIDTISVVARAHHHILWSRTHNYKRDYLSDLEQDRQIFEYWAHAASYLPMKDFQYSLIPKQKIIEGHGHWRPRNKKWNKFVLDRIKNEGALMAKDFKKDPKLSETHLWGGHPVTQALRQLFMEGKLMISGRQGFQKIYDITERVLPSHVHTGIPTLDEYYTYLIKRDLTANGLMLDREIGHLVTIPRTELHRLLLEMVEDGVLIRITIGRDSNQIYYALNNDFNSWQYSSKAKKIHLLSPFDNLLIQRKRMADLFNFEYVLECYVPSSKRKFGYYSLPILFGHQFVGQIDLKADRKAGKLIIKNLLWEQSTKNIPRIQKALFPKLMKYMSFNNCHELDKGILWE